MASADQDLGVAIVGVAIFVVSGDLLGVGPWGFATLALSLFIAASPYVPSVLRFARPIAGLAAVLSILAVLLGLLAATTGGSFRLPLDQTLLLGLFFLLSVCGVIFARTLKTSGRGR